MDDNEARIRELLLRARDLEQEAEGLRTEAARLVVQLVESTAQTDGEILFRAL
jgi:hypothetical protein